MFAFLFLQQGAGYQNKCRDFVLAGAGYTRHIFEFRRAYSPFIAAFFLSPIHSSTLIEYNGCLIPL
jgi:hypothetical protein